MTTLAALRAKLNDEIGVLTDVETAPWTSAQRNAAIGEGYAELWRVGVWKDGKQDFATVTDQWTYALTTIRKMYRLELLDSVSRVVGTPKGIIEPDGSAGFQVRLQNPITAGYTLRVRGWSPFVSTFANDAAVDDLPAEYNRIPLLKAKAILYRQQYARFMRWGEAQAIEPSMNVSAEGLLAGIAQAEREFAEETRVLAAMRPRSFVTGKL